MQLIVENTQIINEKLIRIYKMAMILNIYFTFCTTESILKM